MKRFLVLTLFVLSPFQMAEAFFGRSSNSSSSPVGGEHLIVSGGPSLSYWEDFRPEAERHDRWALNFVRAARVRMQEIRSEHGPSARITWLVYRPAYDLRSREEGKDHIANIESVRDLENVRCRLIWFSTKEEFVRYLNNGFDGRRTKISSFDYFGHSNKYCFTFDYSGEILGASRCYFHQNEISLIRRGIFMRGAACKSWGCHTGESMSGIWRSHTGVRLIGAVGKTDYSHAWQNGGTLPQLSNSSGRWSS